MNGSNFAIELAESRVAAEAEAGVARASATVSKQGAATCIDCGEPIDPARRRAAAFATRCVSCQLVSEGTWKTS